LDPVKDSRLGISSDNGEESYDVFHIWMKVQISVGSGACGCIG
jgi:hypothetical protein